MNEKGSVSRTPKEKLDQKESDIGPVLPAIEVVQALLEDRCFAGIWIANIELQLL
jgi:hypothetical protein